MTDRKRSQLLPKYIHVTEMHIIASYKNEYKFIYMLFSIFNFITCKYSLQDLLTDLIYKYLGRLELSLAYIYTSRFVRLHIKVEDSFLQYIPEKLSISKKIVDYFFLLFSIQIVIAKRLHHIIL